MDFPDGMGIPSTPDCELIPDEFDCPQSISCQAEAGSVVATLLLDENDDTCNQETSTFGFMVKNLTNMPSMVPSGPLAGRARVETRSF